MSLKGFTSAIVINKKHFGGMYMKKLRISLLIVSIALISYGIYSGEMQQVFHKAILICLECVGIG